MEVIRHVEQQRYDELLKEIPQYEEANRKYAKVQQAAQLQRGKPARHGPGMADGAAAKTIAKLEYTADKETGEPLYAFDHMIDAARLSPLLPTNSTSPSFPSSSGSCWHSLSLSSSNTWITRSPMSRRSKPPSRCAASALSRRSAKLRVAPCCWALPNSDCRNLIENFRVVRTNLLAMGTLSKTPHVTMVTSAMPKEGKTVVSSNLAISFSQTGSRTLLIDTDLRRGRLHRLFGLRKSPGLSDYLLGKASLEDVIRPSGKENLSILSAGQHVEAGTELIGSVIFNDLMARLRNEYDRIIMDTPPVLGLSETSVLQAHVDGVLFVIWSGRTPIRNMKTAIDILVANGANFYGFILNRLDLSSTTNYYQYYYYSSDYYHSYHTLENA